MQSDIDVVPGDDKDHVRYDFPRLFDRSAGLDPKRLGLSADGNAADVR